ncbi:MAG TPA: bifunctional oligoribonuclease/PAP phosphatase NrnA [Chloroflexi bacterium]|nr:bifunctional oligoribonuclease/PAP phosphatase NrnA [Chloroflexota bacterium]
MRDLHQQIRQVLADAATVAVIAHVRPDGDAIGSVLGLGTLLTEAGKQVQFILPDGASALYKHMAHYDRIQTRLQEPVDVVVVLDCSDLLRTGDVLNGRKVDINIDHHPTNELFADINLVEVEAAATSQIITLCAQHWGLGLSKTAAEPLMAGILTDTIGFRTSNTTADTLRAAALLMEQGVDMSGLYYNTLLKRSYQSVKLWGRGLEHLQKDGRLAWTVLDEDDRQASRYSGKDDAELTALLATIKGVDVIVVFVAQDDNHVKVSWRATNGVDVSNLAVSFNGGGHAPASGATVEGTLDEVIERVLGETKKLLQERRKQD